MLAFFIIFLNKLGAQNITVLNKYASDSSGVAPENFKLVGSSEFLFIVNDYELVESNSSQNLQGLVNYSVNSFLDDNFKIENQTIKIQNKSPEILKSLIALVNNACWLFDSEYKDEFQKYTFATETKLKDVLSLNGKRTNNTSFEKNNKNPNEISLFYYQKELLQLKKSINKDIANFISKKQYGYSISNQDFYDDPESAPSRIDPIEEELTAELRPIQEMDVMNLPNTTLEKYNKYIKKNKHSKPDGLATYQNDFNNRILQLMESNNRLMTEFSSKFDHIQNQIDGIKSNNSSNTHNKEIFSEINLLKDLVKNFTSNGNNVTNKNNENIVEIYFDYNSTKINVRNKIYLNEVIEGLVKNKTYKILITGFADKAGNPDYNLLLSQRRAIEVKTYLENGGIENNRLLVNFYGDSKAGENNEEDRRVSLEMMVDKAN